MKKHVTLLLAIVLLAGASAVWTMEVLERDTIIHESQLSEPQRDELIHKRTSPQNGSDGYRSDSQSDHEPEDSTTRGLNRRKKTTIRKSELETIVATSPDDHDEPETKNEDEAIKAIAAQGYQHIRLAHAHTYKNTDLAEFSPERYRNYLERIKKLDQDVYDTLIKYEEKFHKPAFFIAQTPEDATVLLPFAETPAVPRMVLPSDLSDEELQRYLDSFKALKKRFQPNKQDLPEDEYQHMMNLLKEFAPDIYQEFVTNEKLLATRQIVRPFPSGDLHALVIAREGEKNPLPRLLIEPLKNLPPQEQIQKIIRAKEDYHYVTSEKEGASSLSFSPQDLPPLHTILKVLLLVQQHAPDVFDALQNDRQYNAQSSWPILYAPDHEKSSIVMMPKDPAHPALGTYPVIRLESFSAENLEKDIESLIQKYRKLSEPSTLTVGKLLPDKVYTHYLDLIKTFDLTLYERLVECEKVNGTPCLRQRTPESPAVLDPSDETHGFPILFIRPEFAQYDDQEQIRRFQMGAGIFKTVTPLSEQDRQKILGIIQKLAPELYSEMVAVDPTGKDHIKPHNLGDGAAIQASFQDGLPVLLIGKKTLEKTTTEQLEWLIGHELSHYVNGDNQPSSPLAHKGMGGNDFMLQEYAPGQKLSVQLPFEETFKKAHTRTKEFAADRGSTMYFGTDIDAAAELFKEWAKRESYTHPEKETFKTTHPLSGGARQAHLKSLRDEVALHRAQEKPLPSIDWKALIREYKGKETEPTAEGDTQDHAAVRKDAEEHKTRKRRPEK